MISFWSCDKPESTYQHVSDALSKELKIDPFFIREFLFDSKSYPLFNRAKVIEQNKKEFIIVPDKKGHAIDFYNDEGGYPEKTINLSLEGPNGVSQISNFQVQENRLYILDAFKYELVVLDLNSVVKDRIRLTSSSQNFTILPRYFTRAELNIVKNKAYFIGDADLNLNEKKRYRNSKLLIEVNLNTKEVVYRFEVPNILVEHHWIINQHFHFGTMVNDTTWAFNVDPTDSLYIYTIGTDKYKAYYLPSKYREPLKYWNKKDLNSQNAYKYYYKTSSYLDLIYDKHRELYYRYVEHPNRKGVLENDLDQMMIRYYSLMVIDKDFNLLAETSFDHNSTPLVPILTKDGLLHPTINELDPTPEGTVRFIRLNLVDK